MHIDKVFVDTIVANKVASMWMMWSGAQTIVRAPGKVTSSYQMQGLARANTWAHFSFSRTAAMLQTATYAKVALDDEVPGVWEAIVGGCESTVMGVPDVPLVTAVTE